jgi:hypothetical protein
MLFPALHIQLPLGPVGQPLAEQVVLLGTAAILHLGQLLPQLLAVAAALLILMLPEVIQAALAAAGLP